MDGRLPGGLAVPAAVVSKPGGADLRRQGLGQRHQYEGLHHGVHGGGGGGDRHHQGGGGVERDLLGAPKGSG